MNGAEWHAGKGRGVFDELADVLDCDGNKEQRNTECCVRFVRR